MSGHLERRSPTTGGLARAGGDGSAHTGMSTSLSQLTFGTKALIYATDMPRTFRQGVKTSTEVALRSGQTPRSGGELILASDAPRVVAPRSDAETRRIEKAVIASGMRQLDKPRKSSGRVVQRRVGWQATADLVVITTAERELTKNDAGKYSPAGPWLIEDRRTYPETSGKATKRVGNVPMDPDQDPSSSSGTPGKPVVGPEASVADTFPEGASSLGMLPAQVRSSAIARVPSPVQFDGVILQEPDSQGNPVRLEVNVLRMDAQRAVVLQATRDLNATQWSVSQAAYRLGEVVIEQA